MTHPWYETPYESANTDFRVLLKIFFYGLYRYTNLFVQKLFLRTKNVRNLMTGFLVEMFQDVRMIKRQDQGEIFLRHCPGICLNGSVVLRRTCLWILGASQQFPNWPREMLIRYNAAVRHYVPQSRTAINYPWDCPITKCCVSDQWAFVLSAHCDACSPFQWRTLRTTELANFLFSPRETSFWGLMKCSKTLW